MAWFDCWWRPMRGSAHLGLRRVGHERFISYGCWWRAPRAARRCLRPSSGGMTRLWTVDKVRGVSMTNTVRGNRVPRQMSTRVAILSGTPKRPVTTTPYSHTSSLQPPDQVPPDRTELPCDSAVRAETHGCIWRSQCSSLKWEERLNLSSRRPFHSQLRSTQPGRSWRPQRNANTDPEPAHSLSGCNHVAFRVYCVCNLN